MIEGAQLPHDFIVSVKDGSPVSLGPRRTSSPHEFYRYPARFSPRFAAAAIAAFSSPDDLVLDPFVGGGTTLVESMRAGRRAVGADLNPLATFVTRAKTTTLDDRELAAVGQWLNSVDDELRTHLPEPSFAEWKEAGYFKDLSSTGTWRLRKLVAMALASLPQVTERVERFCRCIVLRTSQWALDMRGEVPSAPEFRSALIADGLAMLDALREFGNEVGGTPPPVVIDAGLPGLAQAFGRTGLSAPALVLTSPPYPGVYVNYHRWKLRGRREIPAPYWIVNQRDGHGLAHYTMSARAEPTLTKYFLRLGEAFVDLARILQPDSLVVQMVGFSDPEGQLPRYLSTMRGAGFVETRPSAGELEEDGRLWRSVPGRRWWTSAGERQGSAPHTGREVVLFHRRR